eukprot:gene10170-21199_t
MNFLNVCLLGLLHLSTGLCYNYKGIDRHHTSSNVIRRGLPTSVERDFTYEFSKIRRLIPSLVLASTLICQQPLPFSIYAAQAESLTASEMIKSDIVPKVETLKDILFLIRTCGDLIDKQDYAGIRALFRTEPASSLRTTCRKVKLFLPSKAEQDNFGNNYSDMIDSIDTLDSFALKRMQGQSDDKTLKNVLEVAIVKYGAMLQAIPAL